MEDITGFLHSHPMTESRLGLDSEHVIVDKADWAYALKVFKDIRDVTKSNLQQNKND